MIDAIVIEGVRKRFRSKSKRHTTASWVLDDVSFRVQRGSTVGIVGSNGAGKSTLLRTIAGIYTPDAGRITTVGKVVPFIDLSVGIVPRLTVRENMYYFATLLGYDDRAMRKLFDEIVEFSGLSDHLDMYGFQLSNGMKQRLTFSVAAHRKGDIYLFDEVFQGGDHDFQQRSRQKTKELIQGDATVLIVSHREQFLERMCDSVLWLDAGSVRMIGDVHEVLEAYNSSPYVA